MTLFIPFNGGGGGAAVDHADVFVMGAGQSNMWHLTLWDSASGELAVEAALDTYNSGASNEFQNEAVSATYLTKTAYTATGAAGDIYWVDDSVTPFVAGPILTAAVGNIADLDAVTHLLWAQGEADAPRIKDASMTKATYKLSFQWLVDYCSDTFPNFEKFIIQPLGKRDDSSEDDVGYQAVRECQIELEAEDSRVMRAAETYHWLLEDLVHIDRTYNPQVGTLDGLAICRTRNLALTVPTYGPSVTASTISSNTLTHTITHDRGTSLKDEAGTTYTGTPLDVTPSGVGLFRLTDAAGTVITPLATNITGTNQITHTLDREATCAITIQAPYGSLYNLDEDSRVYDTHDLPLRSYHDTASFTAPSNNGAGDGWVCQGEATTCILTDTTVAAAVSAVITARTVPFSAGSRVGDTTGNQKELYFTSTLASTTSLSSTRSSTTTYTTDVIAATQLVQFPDDMVESIQMGTISLTGTTASNTATITSVNTARSVVVLIGLNSGSGNHHNIFHTLDLTNATTVTATAATTVTSSTRSVQYAVIQFKAGVVNSIQKVTPSLGVTDTSATSTITAVNRGRSILFPGGMRKTAGTTSTANFNFCTLDLTNTTTVTFARNTQNGTDTYVAAATVVEFNPGFVSVQRGTAVIASGASSKAQDVETFIVANSWINHLEWQSSYNGTANEHDYYGTIAITDANTVTATRGSTGSNTQTHSFELVSFV